MTSVKQNPAYRPTSYFYLYSSRPQVILWFFVGFLRGQMSYFYLALAIAAEVAGTSLLKVTEEFTKLIPTTFLVIFYLISFWLMTLALRDLPLGIVYAVWSGLGIVLVAIIGAFIYKEVPDLASMIGMALIISGVIVMHLFSKSIQH